MLAQAYAVLLDCMPHKYGCLGVCDAMRHEPAHRGPAASARPAAAAARDVQRAPAPCPPGLSHGPHPHTILLLQVVALTPGVRACMVALPIKQSTYDSDGL